MEMFKEPTPRRHFRKPWVGAVFEIFRKVFDAKSFTMEQEKRFKDLFDRAQDEDAALEAIDLMFQEGVRYPTGRELREAIERTTVRRTPPDRGTDVREDLGYQGEEGYDPSYGYEDPMRWKGPSISFHDWLATQDEEMQARVRRVFPSLRIEP